MNKSLTVVIPAHNEEESIYDTLLEIDSNLSLLEYSRIFVSEDGSQDNTRSEVLRASEDVRNSEVVLSGPSGRLGYSRAVQRGIIECETDLICFMDADGQFDPQDIKNLLIASRESRVVIGFRNPRQDGFNRKAYSFLFGLVYRALGGPRRKDPSSPFIVANTNEVKNIGSVNCHLSFGFWWEFQWRIQKINLEIVELPVVHRVRAAGTTQVYTLRKLPKVVRTHLIGLVKLRRELISN